MTEALSPTKERIAKNEHWDFPETDAKTNRKAARVVDDVTRAWRQGKLEFAHYQAWEKFNQHWEGIQKHDVRVTDTTRERMSVEEWDQVKSGWQKHGEKLAQARSALGPRQFQALELMCQGWGFREVGLHFSPYRTRQQSESYALGKIEVALDILAYEWSLKLKEKIPIRP